jgi:hypothetical protein
VEVKKLILERLKQRFPDLMNEIETRLPTNIAAEMIDNVISKRRTASTGRVAPKCEKDLRLAGQEFWSPVLV